MIASAWRVHQDEKTFYKIQVEKYTSKKLLKEIFADWHQAAFGWNVKENFRITVFEKEFKNEDEWLEWAKKFPAYLTEVKERAGVRKVIVLSNRKV